MGVIATPFKVIMNKAGWCVMVLTLSVKEFIYKCSKSFKNALKGRIFKTELNL